MIETWAANAWDKNKEILRKDLKNIKDYDYISYCSLWKMIINDIYNPEVTEPYNAELTTVIDNGDYQGTLLFITPFDIYQPAEYEYIITFVNYGSCSGCDTLMSIQSDLYDGKNSKYYKQGIEDLMTLCLHMVQHTRRLYTNE